MISPTTTDSEIEDYAAAMMPQLELLTSPYRHYELPYGRFQQYDAVRADGVAVSTMAVEGSDVPLVKHELDIPAPADFVLDLYGRLNYTEIVDPFSFLVRSIQTIQTGGSSRFGWLLVAETIDDMKIPRDSRTRDFCTLDGVDRSRLLQFSKSVDHPLMKEVPFNTVRVPLTYAIRVIPHENDKGSTGPSCRVVQIQHSDSALPSLSLLASSENCPAASCELLLVGLAQGLAAGWC